MRWSNVLGALLQIYSPADGKGSPSKRPEEKRQQVEPLPHIPEYKTLHNFKCGGKIPSRYYAVTINL
jgi:hypothetical protein